MLDKKSEKIRNRMSRAEKLASKRNLALTQEVKELKRRVRQLEASHDSLHEWVGRLRETINKELNMGWDD